MQHVEKRATEETPPREWSGFSDAWHHAYDRIYTIRIIRQGLPASRIARTHPSAVARWLGLSFGPSTAAIAILLVADRSHLRTDIAFLALLGVTNAGMFAAASLAWGYALRRAWTIDDLIRPAPIRDKIGGVIELAVRHRWQAPMPILFGTIPWIVFAIEFDGRNWSSLRFILLLLTVTWTGLILGNDSYWLLVPPWLVIKLRSCRELAFRWNDPARTPGIRTFSEGYAYSAMFLALGAAGVTLPGLLGYDLFGPSLPYLYGLLLTLSLWVGVATQATIYSMVRRFRLAVLDELASNRRFLLTEKESITLVDQLRGDPSVALTVYGSIAASPGLPYGTALVVQYLAAVIGSVVGFLLQ